MTKDDNLNSTDVCLTEHEAIAGNEIGAVPQFYRESDEEGMGGRVSPPSDCTDEEFEEYVASLPKLSNTQVGRYMKLMNRHTGANEEVMAARKVKARAKNKAAKKARRQNRK